MSVFSARAPVRVDCGGGGSDAPPFCDEHGGHVLNFSISRHVHAELEIRPDSKKVTIISQDLNTQANAPHVDALELNGELDLLKGVARRMRPPWGFRLTTNTDAPTGGGLGCSGAACVACVGVFDQAMGTDRDHSATALLADDIERNDLGYAGGPQDSFGAALGGINLISINRDGSVTHAPVNLSAQTRKQLEERLVLVNSGVAHLSSSIHEDIKSDYARADSTTRDAMFRLAEIALAQAAALEAGDISAFGGLLNKNWVQHRRLHESCQSDALRELYTRAEGYYDGAKTCGAGGGGCILFLAKEGRRSELESACEACGGEVLEFGMDEAGLVRWDVEA